MPCIGAVDEMCTHISFKTWPTEYANFCPTESRDFGDDSGLVETGIYCLCPRVGDKRSKLELFQK